MDFLYLDIEDAATAEARTRLGFRATPHFFLLSREGAVIGEWQGVQDRAVLDGALREVSDADADVEKAPSTGATGSP